MVDDIGIKHRLVSFLTNEKKKEIEIVPSSWIYVDRRGNFMCKFMPPPYDEKNSKLLLKMTKNCDHPKDDWPSYLIELRGKAETYEDAVKHLNTLRYQPYVYSTDNDESANLEAKKNEEILKTKIISTNMASELMKSSQINLNNTDAKIRPCNLSSIKPNKKRYGNFEKYTSSCTEEENNDENVTTNKRTRIDKDRHTANTKLMMHSHNTSSSSSSDMEEKQQINLKLSYDQPIASTSSQNYKEECDNTDLSIETYNKEVQLVDVVNKLSEQMTEQYKQIIGQQNIIFKHVNELRGNMIELKMLLEKNIVNNQQMIDIDLCDDNNVNFPCRTITEFEDFDIKLSSDVSFKEKMIQKIVSMINTRQDMVRNISRIMRYYMARDLALKYTPVKATVGKPKIFKTTNFNKLIEGVFIKKFSKSTEDPISEDIITKAVSSVLHHCRDWDGGRSARKRNDNATQEEEN